MFHVLNEKKKYNIYTHLFTCIRYLSYMIPVVQQDLHGNVLTRKQRSLYRYRE